ncbi:MAG: hypothetical protein ACJ74W_23485 [Pyrinomonadaceae bacterium]
MSSLSLHPSATNRAPSDLAQELARLETLLAERRVELAALQAEFHDFKGHYTQVVGSRLAELAELEREIKVAERRALGVMEEADEVNAAPTVAPPAGKTTLRKLFWSVARLFHPDHAADETEARRRHAVMAEANRAYREGDVDSLHTLLGDEQLQSYCATREGRDDPDDLAARIVDLKEELRTVEFGLKRIRQDRLYQLKLAADEAAAHGRDALAAEAARITRQIIKARNRLAHLS